MPTVRFPALTKSYVHNQREFFVADTPVSGQLDNLLARYPTLKSHLIDSDGSLRRHFNIFVNCVHQRGLNGMAIV